MFKKILIPLDNSPIDQAILTYIRPLAKMTHASFILVHVADGYAARYQKQLNLEDSEEMQKDRQYLTDQEKQLAREGFQVKSHLATGEPVKEILSIAEKEQCDLIAMSTHGHRFLKDLILGSVAETLRHRTEIPILMIKATKPE